MEQSLKELVDIGLDKGKLLLNYRQRGLLSYGIAIFLTWYFPSTFEL